MTALWTGEEMVEAMSARPLGELPAEVTGISIDTRTLQPGDAFFAIKGDRFDGHDFMTAAIKAGAALAVVSEDKLVALGNFRVPFLVVRDVLEAMRQLGMAARNRSHAKIIAVTGSAGKTSTKEMLRAVLAPSGKVHASAASFNNHWGVPLTLARMPADTRFGVFEIGMNHAGEIRDLVKLVRPNIALVTTVAPAHIGAFKNVKEIALAKAEIFESVAKGGTALINRDNRFAPLLAEKAAENGVREILRFGAKRGSDFWIKETEPTDGGQKIAARVQGEEVAFALPLAGEHMAMNAVAALGVAALAGADVQAGANALAGIEAVKGRGKRFRLKARDGGVITVIDESYNANPASMEAALKVLAASQPGKNGSRIALLGDMLELGDSSKALHEGLAKPIAASGADTVFLAGEEMAYLAKKLDPSVLGGHFSDAGKLGAGLAGKLSGGDVVMLKASLGLNFASLVERLKNEFPLAGESPRAGSAVQASK